MSGCPIGLAKPESVRRLRRVQAARPPVQARQMLTRRRLADAELVRRGRDRAGRDVGAQDLELAAGRALALTVHDADRLRVAQGHSALPRMGIIPQGASAGRGAPTRPDATGGGEASAAAFSRV